MALTLTRRDPDLRADIFVRRRVSHQLVGMPGVFAVGHIRAGSVKRLASVVGEGSVVCSAVHAHLGVAAVVARPVRAAPHILVGVSGDRCPA